MQATEFTQPRPGAGRRTNRRRLATCRRLIAQINRARNDIRAEFGSRLESRGQLLHLALNEAEALAWQTDFPHLVFPVLAIEKAKDLEAWHKRQAFLERTLPPSALAA